MNSLKGVKPKGIQQKEFSPLPQCFAPIPAAPVAYAKSVVDLTCLQNETPSEVYVRDDGLIIRCNTVVRFALNEKQPGVCFGRVCHVDKAARSVTVCLIIPAQVLLAAAEHSSKKEILLILQGILRLRIDAIETPFQVVLAMEKVISCAALVDVCETSAAFAQNIDKAACDSSVRIVAEFMSAQRPRHKKAQFSCSVGKSGLCSRYASCFQHKFSANAVMQCVCMYGHMHLLSIQGGICLTMC
jgi:hypothetical protein